ncbi:hypothetical protein X943_001491 (apicoplast) [Babesia divergens]|uniref:Large ribosomal subunit protein uL2 C-terminal domain-containing protein n=1 Tax=Babesia divergens TaxID=32595 RepID=A0AAD9LD77_BABDI|nr:hypothetical protein X943_001491 [Babesia divergens]
MIIFKIRYNKSIGKNRGKIIVRHKKTGFNNIYIPIDKNYFNYIYEKNLYFILYTIKTNSIFRNTKLILSLCIKGKLKGESRYILKPTKKYYGDFITFYSTNIKTEGDIDLLKNFFIGNKIYNIKINKYIKFNLCVSAFSYSIIISFIYNIVSIKLPSNKIKYINYLSYASYTFADKIFLNKYKKAGFNILLGNRPKVRGSAMNACDHPHGGGEGKAPIGKKLFIHLLVENVKELKL